MDLIVDAYERVASSNLAHKERLVDFLSEKIIDGIIENKAERRKIRISEARFFGILFEYQLLGKSKSFLHSLFKFL